MFYDQMEHVTSGSPHTLHQQLGWNVCGINGCILAEHHAGVCVFPDLRRTRRQHEQSSGSEGSSAPRFSRPVGGRRATVAHARMRATG